MSSHPSNSEPSPFDRLNEKVQHWIWDKGWNELRDIQAKAIGGVLDGENDVILAATTAAGKTEAAFLPILSSIALDNIDSFAILYVSPLKALINDQFRRLEDLCERLELPVVKWHGDASAAAKARAIQNPRGVVLITPESLESLLVRRGPDVRRLIHDLRFIVIDELHAFLSGERGIHLASLLKRLDATAGRRIRKVGLSATIGDFALAQYFMNPTEPQTVQLIESSLGQPELRLQVRGYREPDSDWETRKPEEERLVPAQTAIVAHLHQTLRGRNNLVFASRRQEVERTRDQSGRWLLANLLDWHRREDKAGWWEYFRLAELPAEDLFDERAGLSGLTFDSAQGGTLKAPIHRYRFPPQEMDIRGGEELKNVGGKPFGKVEAVSLDDHTVDIKKRQDTASLHPEAVFAHKHIGTEVIAEALVRIAEYVIAHGIEGDGPYQAARDLLLKLPPRADGTPLTMEGETSLTSALRLCAHLTSGVLPIQGPPGAGKTFVGANMVVELVRQGKTVGITANTHDAP